jgi:hypothetical protein
LFTHTHLGITKKAENAFSRFFLTFAVHFSTPDSILQMSESNPTIYIDEFDYPLPDERIAKYPLTRRDSSKLLLYQNDDFKIKLI